MNNRGSINTATIILLIIAGLIVTYILTLSDGGHYITPADATSSAAVSPSPSTQTFSSTPSATLTPSQTPTPYKTVYPAYLNCHKDPSSYSEILFEIKGHQIIILAQNQNGDWLYISVEGRKCWIYSNAPYLDLTPNDVTRLPVTEIVMTLRPPPSSPTKEIDE